MRTITDLLKLNGRVYVYLNSRQTAALFLENAEAEGFTFGDGVKPTQRETDDIFALNKNLTINYVGMCGHMAFQTPQRVVGVTLIRVDYEQYMAGAERYIIEKTRLQAGVRQFITPEAFASRMETRAPESVSDASNCCFFISE